MNAEKQLLQAAHDNNITLVKSLLEQGVSPDTQFDDGSTALMYAAMLGNHDVVSVLVDNNCTINIQNSHGATALGYACFRGFIDIVKLLIKHGAEINHQAVDGNTPLMAAILGGQQEVIEFLLQSGANVELKNNEHETAFSLSIAMNNFEAAELMFVDTIADNDLKTALYAGVGQKNLQFITLLFDRFSIDNDTISNALIGAVISGSLEIVQFLLDQGAKVQYKTSDNLTAFGAACYQGHYAIAELLLTNGADCNSVNCGGNTPLIWAASNGHNEIVRLLTAQPTIDVAYKNDNNKDAFNAAIFKGDVETLKLLLACSSDIDKNLLCNEAAYRGHKELIKFFLEDGIDINYSDELGYTALMLAAAKGHREIVELLFEKDAIVNQKDVSGSTALFHAAAKGNAEVVKLLLDKGADVSCVNDNLNTPLLEAAQQFLYLPSKHLTDDVQEKASQRANSQLVLEGYKDSIAYLLKAGSNAQAKNKDDKTALDYAIEKGTREIIELFS